MKQKINLRLIFVAIIAVILTMVSIIFVCYSLFQEQVKKDLRITANALSVTGVSKFVDDDKNYDEKDLRITWIAADGTVLYDNDVLAGTMTNHMDRPEVIDAFLNGQGESIRESDTMNMKTFYHAVLLSDGTVLRVATEARSLTSVFMQVFPIMLLVILLIIVGCIFISHLLTKQLMLPIKEMSENIDAPSESAYKELSPFIERIREQHEDILAAAKNRQDFTANVSHELKTPLTAIAGYAELIENNMVDSEKQIKYAGDIKKNADRLVVLINDIIRLSELDHSQAGANFTQQNIYEIAKERVELLQNNATKKTVSLSLTGATDTLVLSNRGMLIELLDNLIQNAIRYNVPGGKVIVNVMKSDGNTVLTVKDTGIGIPETDKDRIFERFYRVDKSRSRETGGTGLGLAIVKHIVELHNGEIELESEVGKGTTIRVIL